MHRSTKRVSTGLGAVLLSACAFGAAAPAHAAETLPTGTHVEITSTASLYDAPRQNTAIAAELHAGDQAQAFCAFSNDGRDWVKVQRGGYFGFIDRDAVRGAIDELPPTCLSEIESIELPAPGASFTTAVWGAELKGFTCRDSYPFLDTRVPEYLLQPLADNAWEGIMPGISIERPIGIGIDFGPVVWKVNPADGKSYVAGYGDGTISNHLLWAESAKITATCTSNAAYASDTKPGL